MRTYKIENITKRAIGAEWVESYSVIFDSPLEMLHYILSAESTVDLEKLECEVSESIDPDNDNDLFYDFLRLSDDILNADELWIRFYANGSATIFGSE